MNHEANEAIPSPPEDFWERGHMSLTDPAVDAAALACDEQDLLAAKREERRARQQERTEKLSLVQSSTKTRNPGDKREVLGTEQGDVSVHSDTTKTNPSAEETAMHLGAMSMASMDKSQQDKSEQDRSSPDTLTSGDSSTFLQEANIETATTNPASNDVFPTPTVTAAAVSTEDVEAEILARMAKASVAEVVLVGSSVEAGNGEGVRENESKTRKKWKLILGSIVLAIAAIIGGVIAALSKGNKNKDDGVDTPTFSPSLSPSKISSLAPTNVLASIYEKVAIHPEQPLENPESTQYTVLQWLYDEDPNFSTYDIERLRQRYGVATLALGTDTTGGFLLLFTDGLRNALSWLTPQHECDWYGVECDADLRVTAFNLTDLSIDSAMGLVVHLQGTISPEIGLLTNLNAIRWRNLGLKGTIPSEIGLLTNLKTYETIGCFHDGSIPPEVGALRQLEVLSVQGNMLSSTIPSELGQMTMLQELNFGDNDLNGTIPTEIGYLSQLHALDLHENELSGRLPSEIGRLVELERLVLTGNNLQGELPSEMESMRSLAMLYGGRNHFTGALPTGFCSDNNNQTRMSTLELDCNEVACPCCTVCCNLNPQDCSMGKV